MTYSNEDYKGFEIEIIYDECPQNPMEDFDHLGTMVNYVNGHYYGKNVDNYSNKEDMLYAIADLNESEDEYYHSHYFKRDFDPEEYLLKKIAKHSFYVDDDGLFSYVSKDDVRQEWKCKTRISAKVKKSVLSCLRGEIDTLNAWGNGEVFGYQIHDISSDIDSCWGFYGEDFEKNGLMEYAKNAIDCHIKWTKESHFTKIKEWIKNKVPFQYRTGYQLAL